MTCDVLNNRILETRRAKLRFVTTMIPPLVYNMFEKKPAVRGCYAALVACRREGICDPRLSELAFISGFSEDAIVRATHQLALAGLITKKRVQHGVGRPVEYTVIDLDQVTAP